LYKNYDASIEMTQLALKLGTTASLTPGVFTKGVLLVTDDIKH